MGSNEQRIEHDLFSGAALSMTDSSPGMDGVLACHDCDLLHHIKHVPAGGKALCSRCGSLLYRHHPDGLTRVLALNLAALICIVLVNVFPFLSMEIAGRVEETVFISGMLSLYQLGMGELALLVLLTSLLFPLLGILGMLYVLLPVRFGFRLPGLVPVYRLVRIVTPWCMLDVLMLSVLLAAVKLLDLAHVVPGIALYAFIALVVLEAAAYASFDRALLWPPTPPDCADKGGTAADAELISCHTCALLVPASTLSRTGRAHCPRCNTPLHQRKLNSLNRTWALIISALLLLIPANVYPVMTVIRFGQGEPSTIAAGIEHLIEEGMWPLGMIVFVASIIVPFMKLAALSLLQISVQKRSGWRMRDRTVLYRLTELVGSWSMVDIFLIALLTGLVKLDALTTITPDIGALFFAGVVVTTIFAANSFDPRLIWDHGERRQ